jgi:hypothetical protein
MEKIKFKNNLVHFKQESWCNQQSKAKKSTQKRSAIAYKIGKKEEE